MHKIYSGPLAYKLARYHSRGDNLTNFTIMDNTGAVAFKTYLPAEISTGPYSSEQEIYRISNPILTTLQHFVFNHIISTKLADSKVRHSISLSNNQYPGMDQVQHCGNILGTKMGMLC